MTGAVSSAIVFLVTFVLVCSGRSQGRHVHEDDLILRNVLARQQLLPSLSMKDPVTKQRPRRDAEEDSDEEERRERVLERLSLLKLRAGGQLSASARSKLAREAASRRRASDKNRDSSDSDESSGLAGTRRSREKKGGSGRRRRLWPLSGNIDGPTGLGRAGLGLGRKPGNPGALGFPGYGGPFLKGTDLLEKRIRNRLRKKSALKNSQSGEFGDYGGICRDLTDGYTCAKVRIHQKCAMVHKYGKMCRRSCELCNL